MAHRGDTVLSTIKTLLSTGLSFSSNTYRDRTRLFQSTDLPGLNIEGGEERLIADYVGGQQDWELDVSFTLVVSSVNEDHGSLLYGYRTELHKKLRTDYTLGLSYVIDILEVGAEALVLGQTDSDTPIAGQTLHWKVQYRRSTDDPES